MADVTIDDVLAYLKGTVAPYNGPTGARPPAVVNPTTAFGKPPGMSLPSMDDVIATIKTGARPYDNNLPGGGPPRTRPNINRTTKGDIEAAKESVAKQGSIETWMANNLPWITGPLRAAGGAAALPLDVGADLLSRGVHGAFDMDRPEGENYSGKQVNDILEAIGDTAAPFGGMTDTVRKVLAARGATPSSPGAFTPIAAPRQIVEDAPVPGMPAGRRAAVPSNAQAGGQGGAFAAPSVPQTPPAVVPGPMTQEGAFAGPQTPQVPPVVAKSLAEEWRKRSGEIGRDAKGDLTPEQRANAELNFFLGLMAKSARPGARMLGAFGESGQESLKGVAEQQDKNLTRSERKIQQSRDDLYKEMGFENMDRDDKRADRRATIEENRWKATNENDKARLRLLMQQIKQNQWKVLDSKGGTYQLYDAETGTTKDTGIKSPGSKDDRPAEVRLLEHLRKNPDDLKTLLQLKGKDTSGQVTEAKMFDSVMRNLKPDDAGKAPNPSDVLKQAQEVLHQQRGGSPTQADLPADIPPGSKQVGTAKGKPVYEAPDGKRYTVE